MLVGDKVIRGSVYAKEIRDVVIKMEQKVVNPWLVLPPLCLGFFMIMVDTTIVNIAIPSLIAHFGATVTEVGWVNSVYLLTYAAFLLTFGRMGDRFGPQKLFLIGLILFTVASLACGVSQSITQLIVFRAFQGVGAALLTPQTMSIITRVFPPHKRGSAMGIWGSVAGVATIAGPVLGGVFVSTIGWEWIFYVNIPIGVVACVWALKVLPNFSPSKQRLDLPGALLSVVGLACIVFGIQEGDSFNWGHVWGPISIWPLIIIGVLLVALFIIRQWKLHDKALMPLRLFKDRNFALTNLVAATVSFTMIAHFLPFTIFLQNGLGMSALNAALINLPSSLLSGVISPFAGRLSDRINPKLIMLAGVLGLLIGVVLVAALVHHDVPHHYYALVMLVFGVGTGFVFAAMSAVVTKDLPYELAGAGSGAYNMLRQTGSVFGAAAAVSVFQASLNAPSTAQATLQQLSQATSHTLVMVSAVLILGLLATLALRSSAKKETQIV